MTTIYQQIARTLGACINCEKSGNVEWLDKHTDKLHALVKEHLPSGSGVDCGTKLDLDKSTPNKLVFTFGFHHMNEGGYYDGWTEHTCVITPDLQFEISLRITGRDRNQIKDYLYDLYQYALTRELEN